MQDLLLRQTVRNNGRTFNLERHRQSSSDTSSSAEVEPDRDMLSAQVQADLAQKTTTITRQTTTNRTSITIIFTKNNIIASNKWKVVIVKG